MKLSAGKMKIICLFLIVLMISEICGKTPYTVIERTRPTTIQTTHRTATTFGTKKPKIPRELSNFIILVRHIKTKSYTTGVRILPSIIITSKFVKEEQKNEYQIEYDDEGGKTLRSIVQMHTHTDQNMVVLKTSNWSVPDPKAYFHTIPIATRTDRLGNADCQVYAIDDKEKTVEFPIRVVQNKKVCNASTMCATSDKKICVPESGSMLVCGFRLTGIRLDGAKCTDKNPFVFSSVAYADSWILNAVGPGGYFDYDMIRNSRGTSLMIWYTMIFLCILLQVNLM